MESATSASIIDPSVSSSSSMAGLEAYRNSDKEKDRIRNLFGMIPEKGQSALDIGARDGFLALKLADRYASVTALDLETPEIDHPSIACVRGDMTEMEFSEGSFDLVLCAEVLEHIPTALLSLACREITRVARDKVMIGVPYRQDTRLGRCDCAACGGKNPPWGHVNVFDERKLRQLFPELRVEKIDFVGRSRERTNFLSTFLMDLAGNPWGTYVQEEGCVHCGARLTAPEHSGLLKRAAAFAGHKIRKVQSAVTAPQPIWIHVLFSKP